MRFKKNPAPSQLPQNNNNSETNSPSFQGTKPSIQQQIDMNAQILDRGMGLPSVPNAQQIVERMLQKEENSSTSDSNRLQKRFLSFNYDHHLEEAVFSVVKQMWKEESTLQSRRSLWKRFEEFAKVRRYNLNFQMDFAITTFCENLRKHNKSIMNSTLLTYTKALSAIARRLSIQVPITRMYQVGLRALGADRPQQQAKAITFQHLQLVVKEALEHQKVQLRDQLYTLIYLMWKTASRFDEVHLLQSNQIIIESETEIVIDWSNRTKSTRLDSNRPDTWISVVERDGIPRIVRQVLENLHLHSMLFLYSTTWFDKWLKTLPPPLNQYSAHSFKAGAVTMLAHMAEFGHIKPRTVSLMAKHKVDNYDLLPSTTLRYIRDVVTKAHLNESSTATKLMPWSREIDYQQLPQNNNSNNTQNQEYDSDQLTEEDEEEFRNLDQFDFNNEEIVEKEQKMMMAD